MNAAALQEKYGTRSDYERKKNGLLLDRANLDAKYRDLNDFILPGRARFTLSDKNRSRNVSRIFDPQATIAARTLISGMHAGFANPARPWMRLTLTDTDLAEYAPVKTWLHEVTALMLGQFLRSNLYNSLPTLYGDTGVFATGAMGAMFDQEDLMRYYPWPVGTYAIAASDRGVVDTIFREQRMTVRQVVERFAPLPRSGERDWSNISMTVRNLYEKSDYEKPIDVCWLCEPNPDHRPERIGAESFRFLSVYFESKSNDEKVLSFGGFHEFPAIVSRWDIAGEDVYGTDCPGMTALPVVRGLQIMVKRKAQAVEKMVNPPVQGPGQLPNGKVSLIAGDYTPVDLQGQAQGIRPIHETNLPVGEIRLDIADSKYQIDEAFYKNLWLILQQSQDVRRTATEIEGLREEKFFQIGPLLERQNEDVFKPLIEIVYNQMERNEQIPPPPAELDGQQLRVEYESIMHQAMKLVGVGSLDRFVGSVLGFLEVLPEARYKINGMQLVDEYGSALGVSPKIIVPDEEAQAAAGAAQKAAMAQQSAERASTLADAGQKLGNTPVEGDNALSRILEGVGA